MSNYFFFYIETSIFREIPGPYLRNVNTKQQRRFSSIFFAPTLCCDTFFQNEELYQKVGFPQYKQYRTILKEHKSS